MYSGFKFSEEGFPPKSFKWKRRRRRRRRRRRSITTLGTELVDRYIKEIAISKGKKLQKLVEKFNLVFLLINLVVYLQVSTWKKNLSLNN